MISLILQLVFLPFRLAIDGCVGCFIALICLITVVLFGLAIFSAIAGN